MNKITNFKDIPQMTRMGTYEINVDWKYVDEWIEDKKGYRTVLKNLQKSTKIYENIL